MPLTSTKITIELIEPSKMRYDTLGDWWFDIDGHMHIQVSMAAPEDERFLIALHELVEMELCTQRGITQEHVDAFDLAYKGDGEPGDDPKAPYRREHRFAMLIEHLMAHELRVEGYGKVE